MNRTDLTFYLMGKKYGFDLKKMVDFTMQSQYWSADEIHKYQLEKLQKMIHHAYAKVPYYTKLMREMGMEPGDFKAIDDLAAFPIMRKETIQANPESFLASDWKRHHPLQRSTGGTTGIPFAYYNDVLSWGLNWATKIRTFAWGGYQLGRDRIAVMKGGSMMREGKLSLRAKLWRFLQRNYSIPIARMNSEEMEQGIQDIQRYKIRFLRGYPSALLALAKHLSQTNRTIPMKGIFTTAEMLFPEHREEIEKVFMCPINDAYGCGEGMVGASQCEMHSSYHIHVETSYLELVDQDGQAVPAGVEGEIIASSLHDFAMPFIRYAPGDRAVFGEGKCACGRSLPLFDAIKGRASDLIYLPNGNVINGLSLPFEMLGKILKQFQLVQAEDDRLLLNVVPQPGFTAKDRAWLQDYLTSVAGDGVRVEVKELQEIAKTEAGKFRYVIAKKNV